MPPCHWKLILEKLEMRYDFKRDKLNESITYAATATGDVTNSRFYDWA